MKTIISLFSGVGGIDLAFQNNNFKIVYANDFDEKAVLTYNSNFPHKAELGDITKIDINTIPDADILIGGFPCQPFSIAGYQNGFDDVRGTLFFDIVNILNKKKPSVVFLENVKNLLSHDHGNTFQIILKTLSKIGYYVKYAVLNACEYGDMPQNRERIYIIGFLNKEQYNKFEFPNPIFLKTTVFDIIDFDHKIEDKYYYTMEKYPKICKEFQKLSLDIGTVYQWRRVYVRDNKSNLVPCLTANMGTGGHNVPLVFTKFGLRKLTPRECFNVQGFPKDFILPKVNDSILYKQAGNSVCVGVLNRIAKRLNESFN